MVRVRRFPADEVEQGIRHAAAGELAVGQAGEHPLVFGWLVQEGIFSLHVQENDGHPRGLGLLDIKTIFGETAVRRKMRLKLIVHLVRRSTLEENYERLPLHSQTEDVLVDTRGNIYVTDKQWGLFVLRYSGPDQPAPAAR